MVEDKWIYQMKDKKLKKLIQKPLRFHHQDIHEELDSIKDVLKDILLKMEILDQRINNKKPQE